MADALAMSVSQDSQNSLKRDHDSFAFEELGNLEQPFAVDSGFQDRFEPPSTQAYERDSTVSTVPAHVEAMMLGAGSSRRSSSASLTDAGSVTPSLRDGSPMPGSAPIQGPSTQPAPTQSAFAAMNGTGTDPPPAKKAKKLSYAEREEAKILKQVRDAEKAEERAKKEEARKAQAEEKAKKDAEKEEKRLAQEAEKTAKEERKRKKEEEKQRAEEEKKKKERSQKKLNSFFNIPAPSARGSSVEGRSVSPAPSNPSLAVPTASQEPTTPGKKEISAYDKLFLPFFVQTNVTMAPINRFERDAETSEALEQTIDSYLTGDRSPDRVRPFDAISLFRLSGRDHAARGKNFASVKEIMKEIKGGPTKPIDLTSQNTQVRGAQDLLAKIPVKVIKFYQDVRPPYIGTYTKRPIYGIRKLAINPCGIGKEKENGERERVEHLPDTNYDYDSEAEWVEDEPGGEDGEECDDNDEEEEELKDDDGMDGFLDDEDDNTLNARRKALNGHTRTGPMDHDICWEDRRRRNTDVKMMPFRMEFVLDPKMKCVDPLSSEYWQRTPPKKMDPPRVPLNAFKTNSLAMNSATKPTNPFFTPASELKLDPTIPQSSALGMQNPLQGPAPSGKPKKSQPLLPAEDMETFRNEVRGNEYNKLILCGMLQKHLPKGRKMPQIKATLEAYATRVGKKEADKRWVLNDEMTT